MVKKNILIVEIFLHIFNGLVIAGLLNYGILMLPGLDIVLKILLSGSFVGLFGIYWIVLVIGFMKNYIKKDRKQKR